METRRFDKKDVKEVAELSKNGQVMTPSADAAFGLRVIYENEEALCRLKESKGRLENKPTPTIVMDVKRVECIVQVPAEAAVLVDVSMPGTFTVILKKQETLLDYVTNGFPTVGIRMSNDPFVLHLIKECEKSLLVTSTDHSGEEIGVRDEQVLEQLDGKIDAIVLGKVKGKLMSTIMDMNKEEPRIVRKGPISVDDTKEVLHNI